MRLTRELVKEISKIKEEPSWMTEFRLNAFECFTKLDNPNFGPKLDVDYDNINYFKENEEGVISIYNADGIMPVVDDLHDGILDEKYYDMAKSNTAIYTKISYVNKIIYDKPLTLIQSKVKRQKQLVKKKDEVEHQQAA